VDSPNTRFPSLRGLKPPPLHRNLPSIMLGKLRYTTYFIPCVVPLPLLLDVPRRSRPPSCAIVYFVPPLSPLRGTSAYVDDIFLGAFPAALRTSRRSGKFCYFLSTPPCKTGPVGSVGSSQFAPCPGPAVASYLYGYHSETNSPLFPPSVVVSEFLVLDLHAPRS